MHGQPHIKTMIFSAVFLISKSISTQSQLLNLLASEFYI